MKKVFHFFEEIPRNKNSIIFIVFLSTVVVPTLTNLLYTLDSLKKIMDNQLYYIIIVLTINSIWLSLLYFLVKRDSLKLKHLSLTAPQIRKGLFVGFALFIAVNMVLVLKTFLVEESLWLAERFSSLNSTYKALRVFIFNVFTGALVEELLFRAYAIPQVYLLLRIRVKHKITALILALFLTQLLFAMVHLPRDLFRFDLDLATIISKQSGLFMSGIILSLVYLRTRNVIFLAVFHAFLNYGLPITGTDADFKLYYTLAAFTIVVFWEKIIPTGKPKKEIKPTTLSEKVA